MQKSCNWLSTTAKMFASFGLTKSVNKLEMWTLSTSTMYIDKQSQNINTLCMLMFMFQTWYYTSQMLLLSRNTDRCCITIAVNSSIMIIYLLSYSSFRTFNFLHQHHIWVYWWMMSFLLYKYVTSYCLEKKACINSHLWFQRQTRLIK